MFSIAFGNAASEEVLANAISAGSFTIWKKARIGTRAISAAGTSATRTNTTSAPYSVSTSLPRFTRTPMPLCPAYFMTMPVNLNIVSASPPQKPSMASLGPPRTWESATAKRMEKKTIWSTSLLTAASKKLWGTMCSRNPLNDVVFCASC